MQYNETLKQEILQKVTEYYQAVHAKSDKDFVEGKSRVNYAGRVFDETEMQNLVSASLDFWLTQGEWTDKFEKKLAEFLGVKYASFVNSGSSANLLAFMALTSSKLGDKRIKKGDEVITVAAGFPTTVAPVVQYGAVPVFVDVDLETFNIDTTQLAKAYSSKTKAVMLAHTLGNPFDISAVKTFCEKHHLWLIEDNCDALGSMYDNKYTGTFGHIGTSSFYPPHHLTTGEGGAVYTNDIKLYRIINSFRDWGRDCWCHSGKDDTCHKRFTQQFGTLPFGYDHKYVYSHLGYNLKATDLQAAIGVAQLAKLPAFIKKRRVNFDILYNGLKELNHIFILPQATAKAMPSWFGFWLTIKDHTKLNRNDLVKYLEQNNIQTRNLFAGNITRHPCFTELEVNKDYRIVGKLENTDKIMSAAFWVGVYPGMKPEALQFMVKKIKGFVK
jgi:CDP-4-dehydro-6-deoxyglucose reductase, E1